MSKDRLEAIDGLAERFGLTRSELLRRFDAYAIESNMEVIALEGQIDKLRDEIKSNARPIDMAGGFGDRVQEDFEKRFKSNYGPKWLVAKAESYREEARMLESKLPQHPDAPEIEPGELVDEVDEVLADTLEAACMSDWTDRYDNALERFDGVESGRESRQLALALARTALRIDREYATLSQSSSAASRRVEPKDLPDTGNNELPEGVTLDDVATVGRRLAEEGVTADQLDTDPTEFDPFAEYDLAALEAAETATVESPEPASDGGVPALPDGGSGQQTVAVEAVETVSTDTEPNESGTDDSGTQDTEHMDLEDETPTTDELISELADFAEQLGGSPQTRQLLLSELNPKVGQKRYARRVRWDDLDADDVVDRALEAAGVTGAAQ